MPILPRIQIEGKHYVLLEESAYERLCREAGRGVPEDDLPPLPKPDRTGRYPAIAYARISIARDLIRERKALGLSQRRLADLAAIRQETLSRIESGKHTATTATIDKLTQALDQERRRQARGRR